MASPALGKTEPGGAAGARLPQSQYLPFDEALSMFDATLAVTRLRGHLKATARLVALVERVTKFAAGRRSGSDAR